MNRKDAEHAKNYKTKNLSDLCVFAVHIRDNKI